MLADVAITLERHAVFRLYGVPVTTTVITTWALLATLGLAAVVAGRNLRERPARWQAVVEWGVSAVRGLISDMTGEPGELYVPLVATVGLFVLTANLMSVLPFVDAPTADLNTPVTLAVIVFFSVHYFGVRKFGLWGYIQKFTEPSVLLLPFNLIGNVTRTFSLAIRLFGNMLSHQIIVAVLLLILPLIVPAVLQVFGLFIGVLQAYIFTILTVVYIAGAVRAEGEVS
jgi:F-type H+-transporting ATPase subunit a